MDVLTATPVLRRFRSAVALRRWAVASLVVNIVIIVTGALVRLTDSGLGCPTWPKCSQSSYVSHAELGVHGAIEFGNRLLTFVLVAVAVLTWLTAMAYRENGARRRDLRWLTAVMALGIPAQAVIGGITVLTHLNPFIVALHLLVSFLLVGLSVSLVRRTYGTTAARVRPPTQLLVRVTFGLMVVAVWLGTVVTGSGPHAGDQQAVRTGFDPELVSHLHANVVYLTVAATLACVVVLRSRAAAMLLALEVAQAGVGVLQYNLGLPIGLVALHLLGAGLAIALASNLLLSVRAQTTEKQRAATLIPQPTAGSRSGDTRA